MELFAGFYLFYMAALAGAALILFSRCFPIIKTYFKDIALADFILLIFLCVLGLVFRLRFTHHIDLDPYGWKYIQDAIAIKKLMVFSFTQFDISEALHIPGYAFMIAGPLLISETISAVSFFNVIFSVLTIAVVWFISWFITKDRRPAMLAAGMFCFSVLHVAYSGEEIPVSISVFFVTLEMLFLVLWVKTKDIKIGWFAVALFIISFNIKIENIIFAPVFLTVFFKEKLHQGKPRKYLMYFLVLFLISVVFWFPYIINVVNRQISTFNFQSFSRPGPADLFNMGNFTRHFHHFFIHIYRGFPLIVLAGYILLIFSGKGIKLWYVSLVWFFSGIICFFWYSKIFSEWTMLQILIPVFIMTGDVFSQTLSLFFRKLTGQYAVLILLLFVMALNVTVKLGVRKVNSWVDFRHYFRAVAANDCIVSLDTRDSSFSLRFLFPEKKWIFLNKTFSPGEIDQCEGNVYFFNPVPYGLEEETDMEDAKLVMAKISDSYKLKKIARFKLYEMQKRQE